MLKRNERGIAVPSECDPLPWKLKSTDIEDCIMDTRGDEISNLANPEADDWLLVDLWLGFGLMVFCFVVLVIEDKVRG